METTGVTSTVTVDKDAGASSVVQMGYGESLSGDSAMFASSMQKAEAAQTVEPVEGPNAAMKAVLEPLDFIDNEAQALIDYAEKAVASGEDMTPSEIVMLTAKSQEFMFHSQLTSNIANRTADGLSQLFRQQS
ncbi:MAG: hypothetical protein V3U65_13470 [Granulosicoccaceae bacterium]